MTKIDKINKLNQVLSQLKTEFIGLDSIIDEIGNAITPWYVTPEVISRPVVISLWGMTGTGKSSVIRRLIKLLDLESKTLNFDCGLESNDGNSSSISDKICDFIQADDLESSSESITKDLVFVFDEFQYARTLDESGSEINKSNLRPVWSLMDSGIINLNQSSWDIGTYCNFVEDFNSFVASNPGIKVKNCEILDPDDVKKILSSLGLFYYSRGLPGITDGNPGKYGRFDYESDSDDSDSSSKNNPYRPLRVIEDSIFRILVRRLKAVNPEFSNTVISDIFACTCLDEILDILLKARRLIMTPKYLNCSNSLIVIIGNLDEAFNVEDEINPDLDADIFYDETRLVSISDIKEALKKRFRAEQIARFGNSIIKYPTLKKEHFDKVIDLEITRVCAEFNQANGLDVSVTPGIHELIYSEGVYPVQGVRPVFTTIGTILIPLFSKILIYTDQHGKENLKIVIDTEDNLGFKRSSCGIAIKYFYKDDIFTEIVKIPLSLGELRDPKNRKTRVINSVHEAGHAIVLSYLTGQIPPSIVSVSTDHGGFCITHDKDKINEIKSKLDVANDVCISLAGYEAEMLIFGDRPEMTLCGSSSDIDEAWRTLSDVAYTGGYFSPFSYTNLSTEDNTQVPSGMSDKDYDLTKKIRIEFCKLREKTQDILKGNTKLIVETAKILSDKGSIDAATFKDLIEYNKGTLTPERLNYIKENNSFEWYDRVLDNILKK